MSSLCEAGHFGRLQGSSFTDTPLRWRLTGGHPMLGVEIVERIVAGSSFPDRSFGLTTVIPFERDSTLRTG